MVLDSRNATQYLNDSFISHLQFEFEQPIFLPRDALNLTCSVFLISQNQIVYTILTKQIHFCI